MGKRIYVNDGWKFAMQYEEKMKTPEFDDSGMVSVRLPHTCRETPQNYFDEQMYQTVCGYRKTFDVTREWEGKRVLLTVEGAAHESTVYVNGEKAGEHRCGYTAYVVDISGYLRYGEKNVLTIRVDSRESLNIPPFGFAVDYMTYGGIYRDVYIELREPVYLKDVYVHGTPDGTVYSEITKNEAAEGFAVRQSILLKGEKEKAFFPLGECAAEGACVKLSFKAGRVKCWDLENPALYTVKTELLKDGRVCDEVLTDIGFRDAEFRGDGFYLNGKKIKIRGMNRHQSYPYVGYAMPEAMQKMDADILKNELGVNAVRTSHYPQSHYFLDRCDELGLLVFTELPGWQYIGDAQWKRQAVENVRDMVYQYRNHTSIILWGVRINESPDDDAFYEETNEMAHSLDPYRQTGGVRAHKKSSFLEDVYTYNDFVHDGAARGCEKKAAVTPDKRRAYLVSEYNGHMYPAKAYDCEEHRTEHMLRHAAVLDAVAQEEDIAGSFAWCMFDYNTHKDFGSGDRVCYHGVTDMFRNPKPAAEVYACQQERDPVLFVSSSMDIGEHPGCSRGSAYLLTNADSVRMYKKDCFVKEYRQSDSAYRNLLHGPILIDDYIGDAIEKNETFKPAQARDVKKILGTVARLGLNHLPLSCYFLALKLVLFYRMKPAQAVALYNRYVGDWGGSAAVYRFDAVKDGKVVKSVVKKPMRGVLLRAQADHLELCERHSYDVAAVRIRAEDENGNLLSYFQEPVRLKLEGEACLIGPSVISLKGGMSGTYVKSTGKTGNAVLTITTEQAACVRLEFTVQAHDA